MFEVRLSGVERHRKIVLFGLKSHRTHWNLGILSSVKAWIRSDSWNEWKENAKGINKGYSSHLDFDGHLLKSWLMCGWDFNTDNPSGKPRCLRNSHESSPLEKKLQAIKDFWKRKNISSPEMSSIIGYQVVDAKMYKPH